MSEIAWRRQELSCLELKTRPRFCPVSSSLFAETSSPKSFSERVGEKEGSLAEEERTAQGKELFYGMVASQNGEGGGREGVRKAVSGKRKQ